MVLPSPAIVAWVIACRLSKSLVGLYRGCRRLSISGAGKSSLALHERVACIIGVFLPIDYRIASIGIGCPLGIKGGAGGECVAEIELLVSAESVYQPPKV
jgi:hypothetical protein